MGVLSNKEEIKLRDWLRKHTNLSVPLIDLFVGSLNDIIIRKQKEYLKQQIGYCEEFELPYDSNKFIEAWKRWLMFRKEKNWGGYKKIGHKSAIKDLLKNGGDTEKGAIITLEHAIEKGHRGFYFKSNANGKAKQYSNLKEGIRKKYKQQA